MAGQTADIRRGLTAEAARTAGQAAVDIAVQVRLIAGPAAAVGIEVPARLTADPAAGAGGDIVAAAALPIAGPAAAVEDIAEVEAVVRAEVEAVVRAEVEAAARIRLRHMVAAAGPIGKI